MKNFKVEVIGAGLVLDVRAKTYGEAAAIGTLFTWDEEHNFGYNNIKTIVTNLANGRKKVFFES